MKALPVDLVRELNDLVEERDILSAAIVQAQHAELSRELDMMVTHGLAGYVEQIYTGAERCLAIIAKEVDDSPIDKSEGWHKALLDRMSAAFSDRRPAVLSTESRALLDDLRSFRHVVRNNYGSRLEHQRVIELAAEAIKLPGSLTADFKSLAAALQENS